MTRDEGDGWPRFRLGSALAGMVLLCLLFALMGGLLRATRSGEGSRQLPLYVLLSVAAPIAVMILLDLVLRANRWWKRRGKDEG